MTQTSFPFENIDTTETQFSQMFRNFQDGVNGTYGGTELTVSAGTGLAVDVSAGQAMVRGHYYISTATESLALATADATNPRLDLVVLKLDPVLNSIVLAVKTGTPGASPVAPTPVQTDAGVWEMPLAQVLVPATAGVPSTITDLRRFMGGRISMWSDDTRPTTEFPHVGYNVDQETFEGYDPITQEWGPIGGGGGVTIASTAPTGPADGDLWWDSDSGSLYLYYTDADSSQWVSANGPQVIVSTSAPAGYQGQLWFDSTDGKTYIYYDDGTSGQWVSAIGGSLSGNVIQVVSTTKTDTFSTSSTSFVDITGLNASITPRSTSSKILVIIHASISNDVGVNDLATRLVRDSTPIYVGDTAGSRTLATTGTNAPGPSSAASVPITYLDSPTSTATLNYKLQMRVTTSSGYLNRSDTDTDSASFHRYASSITLMEIAG